MEGMNSYNRHSKKPQILPVDKICGLVIIKVIEQLAFATVGSLRVLLFERKPSSRCEVAFFHAIVYLRNERMAMISMPKVSMSINDS